MATITPTTPAASTGWAMGIGGGGNALNVGAGANAPSGIYLNYDTSAVMSITSGLNR